MGGHLGTQPDQTSASLQGPQEIIEEHGYEVQTRAHLLRKRGRRPRFPKRALDPYHPIPLGGCHFRKAAAWVYPAS